MRVDYQLTEKGRALKPALQAIHTWAERWMGSPPVKKPAAAARRSRS